MAAYTVQPLAYAGTKPNFALDTPTLLGDTAAIDSGIDTFVVYKNTDTNVKTITITVPGNTSYGLAKPQPALTLAASTGELWIPLVAAYKDNNGNATLTISGTGGVTGVTVALVRLVG